MPNPIHDEMKRRRWRRWRMGITVMIATLLVLGVVLEIGIRILVPSTAFEPLANLYAAHEDPAVAYVLQPGLSRAAFGVPLRANGTGFRGDDWSPQKLPGTRRIALIGDSHAFGFGVAFEATVGQQLARRLDARTPGVRHEVLNFALPGYNSTQQRAVLESIALRYEPDAVVVMYCNNDHRPTFWCDGDGFLRRGTRESGDADARLLSWPEKGWMRAKESPLGHSRLYLYLRLQWLRYRQKQRRDREVAVQDSVTDLLRPDPQDVALATIDEALRTKVWEPLHAMGRTCQQHELPVVFACVSSGPVWLKMLTQLGDAFGAPTVGLFSLFPEVSNYGELQRRFSLGWDSHLNAEAHRRWAEAIAPLLPR